MDQVSSMCIGYGSMMCTTWWVDTRIVRARDTRAKTNSPRPPSSWRRSLRRSLSFLGTRIQEKSLVAVVVFVVVVHYPFRGHWLSFLAASTYLAREFVCVIVVCVGSLSADDCAVGCETYDYKPAAKNQL